MNEFLSIRRRNFKISWFNFQFLGEYLSDAATSAAKVGQNAVNEAASIASEYATAGAKVTQDAFKDYVSSC